MPILGEDLKKLSNFYKSIKVTGKSVEELCSLGSNYKTLKDMPAQVFQIGSWHLRKIAFINIEELCRKYYKKFGSNGYYKYCEDNCQNVTKDFFEYVTEDKYLDDNQSEILRSIYETPIKPKEKQKRSDSISKNFEKIYGGEKFQKMLPVNWGIMTTGERIEFSMTVKNKEFLGYIYSIEPSIKDFVKRAQKENPKQKDNFDLYVSIFKFPPDAYPDKFKNLIRELVEKLNDYGRANLQYVECSYPPMIEIREIR